MGQYGTKAKKLFKFALSNNLVSFLGTDIHRSNSYLYNNFDKCLNKIEKIIGKYNLVKITCINPKELLENKEIR